MEGSSAPKGSEETIAGNRRWHNRCANERNRSLSQQWHTPSGTPCAGQADLAVVGIVECAFVERTVPTYTAAANPYAAVANVGQVAFEGPLSFRVFESAWDDVELPERASDNASLRQSPARQSPDRCGSSPGWPLLF